MLGRQIAACDPAVCSNDIPDFNIAGAGKIVRRARIDCYGSFSNLAFYTLIDNRPVPFCPAGRPTRNPYSKVYLGTGEILYDQINNDGGYWIQEYEWSYSSATVHSFTGTVYKRPGTNTVICNNFNAVVMRYSYTASYYKIEYTLGVDSYVPWGSTFENCCSSVETQIDAVVRNPVVWFSATGSTFGSGNSGVPTTISFYYKPIATANKDGLVIQLKSAALASGPWKVSTTSGSIVIENNSGTQYTFSGTLSAAASAISATAGSTLFTASVPSGVLGSVALVSDLKPIDFAQISTATCNIGLPIILAGEPVPPSNISSSHFLLTFASGSCVNSVNLSYASAVLEGFEDTHDAYESWLRTPRYPKFPDGFADVGYYINDPTMPSEQLFIGCTSGFGPLFTYNILNYWSLTPGDSLREYESFTDGGLIQEVLNWELSCSECQTSGLTGCVFSIFKTTFGCGYPPPNPTTGAGGFFDCPPFQVSWYGWNPNLSTTNVPVETLRTSMKLSGVWSFE